MEVSIWYLKTVLYSVASRIWSVLYQEILFADSACTVAVDMGLQEWKAFEDTTTRPQYQGGPKSRLKFESS